MRAGVPPVVHGPRHLPPLPSACQHDPCRPPPCSANTSPPSLIADMLCSALGVIGFSWVSSPAATELEAVRNLWLARCLFVSGCSIWVAAQPDCSLLPGRSACWLSPKACSHETSPRAAAQPHGLCPPALPPPADRARLVGPAAAPAVRLPVSPGRHRGHPVHRLGGHASGAAERQGAHDAGPARGGRAQAVRVLLRPGSQLG